MEWLSQWRRALDGSSLRSRAVEWLSQWRRALDASAVAAALVAELLQSCTVAAALMAALRSRAAAELLAGRFL